MIKMLLTNIKYIIILLTVYSYLYPCSCLEPPAPEEAYEDADIVFSGQVTNIVVDGSGYYYNVTFQIMDVWKGEMLNEIIILTETTLSECGYDFQINNEYLIYAYSYASGFYTNICTRTNLLEYASEDLDYLNQLSICDNGYFEIDGYCFYEDDITVLQTFINNSLVSDWHDNNECEPWDFYCGSPNPYMDAFSDLVIDGEYINSLNSNNNNIVEVLELGHQEWDNGRLKGLMCGAFIYCGLSGEIPSSISNLTEINVLRLEVNYFSGYVPESICDFQQLDYENYLTFDLSYNQLCPPYPSCIEDFIEYQDISNCSVCPSLGDVNNDNEINVQDILLIVNCILDYNCEDCSDLNQDSTTNVIDILILVDIILNPEEPVTDIDGNVYQTIQIGEQLWMSENLKATHYQNGDVIPNITNNEDWGSLSTGAYGDYDNNPLNSETYGRIYNWYTVNDTRGVCPLDYHVPTDSEYTILTDFLGGISIAGGKMKEVGTDHWNSPNTGATNESGFTGLPSGYRNYGNGYYYYLGNSGYFWSSTEAGSNFAWYRKLHYYYSNVYRYDTNKTSGFAVRCLRD